MIIICAADIYELHNVQRTVDFKDCNFICMNVLSIYSSKHSASFKETIMTSSVSVQLLGFIKTDTFVV